MGHIPFFPIVPQEEGKDQSQTGREEQMSLFPRIIEVVCTVLLEEKENPPPNWHPQKLCTEYFQGKVTVYNMSFKDNYFLSSLSESEFWDLIQNLNPQKKTMSTWLFFFLPELLTHLNALF